MFYNWDVIGHERELAGIEADVLSGNLHHAYLFVGPENIGKLRIAKTLAGILQCPNNYCRTCPTCIQVEKGSHADTIDVAEDSETIDIETIRDLLVRLSMTGQSRYKIILVGDIGRLTASTGNLLLKILEEPPPRTIFLFTAGQVNDILPTIASRMRTIRFKKIPGPTLKHALKERFAEVDAEMIEQVVMLSLGRSGRAIKLLTNEEIFTETRDLYQHIEFLHQKASKAARIVAMGELSKDHPQMMLFLQLLVHYAHNELIRETDFGLRMGYITLIEKTHKVMNLIGRNINARLLLEDLMLTM